MAGVGGVKSLGAIATETDAPSSVQNREMEYGGSGIQNFEGRRDPDGRKKTEADCS